MAPSQPNRRNVAHTFARLTHYGQHPSEQKLHFYQQQASLLLASKRT